MKLTLLLLLGLIMLFVLFMAVTITFLLKLIIRTAPEDIREIIMKRPDPPVGHTVTGVILAVVILALIAGVIVYAGYDARNTHMSFGQTFMRFLILFEGYKVFDMVVFDWLLLTKLNVYQTLFPETAGCKGYEQFGFNLNSQLVKLVLFAGLAALAAYVSVGM